MAPSRPITIAVENLSKRFPRVEHPAVDGASFVVEQGEFVVFPGARIPVAPNPRVAIAPFLGEPAPFPVGPYVLASLLRCPVFLIFSIRTESASELHFELLRESICLPRKGRDQALAELTAEYAERLEHYTLRAPLQWFNFYDFWHLPTMDKSDAPR